METCAPDRVLTIRPISYVDVLDQSELLAEYAEECSIPEIGTPNPQRETYARMESYGLMHSFGMFDGVELVGFASILVFVLPHYGKQIANVESLFLRKSHRRGFAGTQFLRHIEAWAAEKKCAVVLYNARAGSRLEKLLFSLKRYQRTNSVFLWSAS
jgi:GNAT superfamily N-acetyltransferase